MNPSRLRRHWKDALVGILAAGWLGTLAVFLTDPPTRPVHTPPAPAPAEPVPPPSAPERAHASVAEAVRSMQQAPGFEAASIGFCVLDPSGDALFAHRADEAMIPASTLKTLTAATGLELLGPDFRWETRVAASAPPDDEGKIAGDLWLVGGGDPTLADEDLADLADQLAAAGVTAVTGAVVGDARALPEHIADDFWNWGDVGNYYGAGAAGLNIGHNRFTARFQPGANEGDPAGFLEAVPDVPEVQWVNRVLTGPPGSGDGVVIFSGPYAATITLRGTVPAGEPAFEVHGAVPDPPLRAAATLRAALEERGIAVAGEATTDRRLRNAGQPVPEPDEAWVVLATHASPPLIDVINHLLLVSDNLETECLFRSLGERFDAPPDAVVRRHWSERGLALGGLRMEDGSGLARANHIRPSDLARLQLLAATGPRGGLYRSALPVQMDGSIRWKGGAMSGVRAYTGLLDAADGRELAFALMINHYESDAAAIRHWRTTLLESARALGAAEAVAGRAEPPR